MSSTDLGVAFLVRVDGMTLYHAGDLFPWNGSEMEFLQYTAPLQGVHIDYAMLPMDPRFPSAAEHCVSHYLKLADITYFTPMHLWDKPDSASTFAQQNPQHCGKMIAVNPKGVKICQSIRPLQPFTITLEAPHTESIQKAAPKEIAPTQTREELLYAIGQYYATDTLEAAQRLDLSITNIFEIRKQDDATLRALLDDLKKHASS